MSQPARPSTGALNSAEQRGETRLQELWRLSQRQQETDPGPGHYQVRPHPRNPAQQRGACHPAVDTHNVLSCHPHRQSLRLPSPSGAPTDATSSPWMVPSRCNQGRPAAGRMPLTPSCCCETLASALRPTIRAAARMRWHTGQQRPRWVTGASAARKTTHCHHCLCAPSHFCKFVCPLSRSAPHGVRRQQWAPTRCVSASAGPWAQAWTGGSS
jgi:hypothetical protein